MKLKTTRVVAGGLGALLVISLAGCVGGDGPADAPNAKDLKFPSSPVTLNLVDVSGDVVIAQPMIEAYMEAHPDRLAKVNFDTGDATEIDRKSVV